MIAAPLLSPMCLLTNTGQLRSTVVNSNSLTTSSPIIATLTYALSALLHKILTSERSLKAALSISSTSSTMQLRNSDKSWLCFRTINEIIGHTELLLVNELFRNYNATKLDLSRILTPAPTLRPVLQLTMLKAKPKVFTSVLTTS